MPWLLKLLNHWDIISVSMCSAMFASTAIIRYYKGDMPMTLTFAAYAVANIGLLWSFK